jgi:hypothetical protein
VNGDDLTRSGSKVQEQISVDRKKVQVNSVEARHPLLAIFAARCYDEGSALRE